MIPRGTPGAGAGGSGWGALLTSLLGLLVAGTTLGCDRTPRSAVTARPLNDTATAAGEPAQPPLTFRSQELPFRYERGESGAAWPVEATGGGVGLIDYDGDGDLDLFFAQGVPLPVGSSKNPPADCLLRNDGGGKFVDVSATAGLTSKGYGQGVAVGDYDGDGDPDVYITRYGTNTLWRNDRGTFTDATDAVGVGCGRWSLGAMFFDYDHDGDLDLFVANYFDFDEAAAPFARDESGKPRYSLPSNFSGQPDVLYRNDGAGRFTDVTAKAGVAGRERGMACAAADFDGDGRIDILVANDAESNVLWRNRGDGTFEDVAAEWGIAVSGRGLAQANMGIACGDTDGDGTLDVVITHFFGEHTTLWRALGLPDGRVTFQDQSFESGLGIDSQRVTGWGTALADFDLDGRLDLIQTNGHIRREPTQTLTYENPPLLWRDRGDGRFINVTDTAGPYFQANHLGRGLAVGDLDGDGDTDIVVVHHHTNSVVLWNETPRHGHFLTVKLQGPPGNKAAIGAKLTATIGKKTLVRTIDGGGSYVSTNDPTVVFGLGNMKRIDRLEVRWPSGRVEARSDLPADRSLVWVEGESPTSRRPGADEKSR